LVSILDFENERKEEQKEGKAIFQIEFVYAS